LTSAKAWMKTGKPYHRTHWSPINGYAALAGGRLTASRYRQNTTLKQISSEFWHDTAHYHLRNNATVMTR